jgi:hypothetical protein
MARKRGVGFVRKVARLVNWRTCANCGEAPVAGCLCHRCLRASLTPLVLAAIVQWIFKQF